MPRWFVTGAGGQLATAFSRVLEGEVFLSREEALDIRDADAVRAAVRGFAPDAVLHCAAYTNVDGAEADPATAEAVNVLGTRNIVRGGARHAHRRRLLQHRLRLRRRQGRAVRRDRPHAPAQRLRAHQARRREGGARLGARHRLQDLVAVQRDRPQLREDDPRRGHGARRHGRAASGRRRPGRLADLRRAPRRRRRRGAATGRRPGHLPPRRQRLLLVVRAGRARSSQLAGLEVEVEPITTAEAGRPARRPAFSALDTRAAHPAPAALGQGVAEAVDRLIPLG